MTALYQLCGALGCVGAAAGLAAVNVISGSDALAVISAVAGYFIHASGVVLGTPTPAAAPKE